MYSEFSPLIRVQLLVLLAYLEQEIAEVAYRDFLRNLMQSLGTDKALKQGKYDFQ